MSERKSGSWGFNDFFSEKSRQDGSVGDVNLASFIGHLIVWSFLPHFLVSLAQAAFYKLFPSKRPGSEQPKLKKLHYLLTYSILLMLYVVYASKQTMNSLPTNFYSVLEVSPEGFKMSRLRANFRHYSLMYHPDKAQEDADTDELRHKFLSLQKAYNVLKDTTLRQAYYRFGTDALKCPSCKTEQDFYELVFWQSYLLFYLPTGFVMMLLMLIVPSKRGVKFWNTLVFFGLAATEAYALLHGIPGLRFVFPLYTLHEKVVLLRQVAMSAQITMSHLGPMVNDVFFDTETMQSIMDKLDVLRVAIIKQTAQSCKEYLVVLGGTNPEKFQALAVQVADTMNLVSLSERKQIKTLVAASLGDARTGEEKHDEGTKAHIKHSAGESVKKRK